MHVLYILYMLLTNSVKEKLTKIRLMQCEVRKKLGKQVVLQSIFYKSPSIFPGALKTVVNRKVLKCILSLIIDNHTFDECRSSLGLKLGSS